MRPPSLSSLSTKLFCALLSSLYLIAAIAGSVPVSAATFSTAFLPIARPTEKERSIFAAAAMNSSPSFPRASLHASEIRYIPTLLSGSNPLYSPSPSARASAARLISSRVFLQSSMKYFAAASPFPYPLKASSSHFFLSGWDSRKSYTLFICARRSPSPPKVNLREDTNGSAFSPYSFSTASTALSSMPSFSSGSRIEYDGSIPASSKNSLTIFPQNECTVLISANVTSSICSLRYSLSAPSSRIALTSSADILSLSSAATALENASITISLTGVPLFIILIILSIVTAVLPLPAEAETRVFSSTLFMASF